MVDHEILIKKRKISGESLALCFLLHFFSVNKQKEAARRAQRHGANVVDNQPKKGSLLSRNR